VNQENTDERSEKDKFPESELPDYFHEALKDLSWTVPLLVDGLNNPDPEIRALAQQALSLRGITGSPDEILQSFNSEILSNLSEPALNAALQALQDPDKNVRTFAAQTMGAFRNEQGIEALVETLNNSAESIEVRRAAAFGLGQFKTIDNPLAVEALIKSLISTDQTMRQAAAFSLGQLKDKSAVEPLVAVVNQWCYLQSE
jgi:HEAT repeat protein